MTIPQAVIEQAQAMANATQVTHYIALEGAWLITPEPPQGGAVVILPRTPQRRYGVLRGY